jgi:transketolase
MLQKDKTAIARAEAAARTMRRQALELAYAAGPNGAHLGPGLSMIELMAALYGGILRVDPRRPDDPDRDRFLLSKGHGVLAYYTALAQAGFLTEEELRTFERNEGILPGHPVRNPAKGIETSSGSLGMGLSIGIGSALAGRKAGRTYRVYVLMGDGECGEGSVWEAAMAAAHYRLGNLTGIVDRNELQYDGPTREIMDLGDLAAKWRSFGWDVAEIDGHSVREIFAALAPRPEAAERPYLVIARTVKGKGVSFMEGNREWHHGRLSKAQFETAMAEQGV